MMRPVQGQLEVFCRQRHLDQ